MPTWVDLHAEQRQAKLLCGGGGDLGDDDNTTDGGEPDVIPPNDDDNVVRVDFGRKRDRAGPTRREIPIPKATNLPRDPLANQKLEAFAKLIDLGMCMVTFDARRPGVVVPPINQGELQLNLNFSQRFGIDDFRYDEDDVRASLSFGGVPHLCIVPWSAVYMIRSHVTDDVAVFPSDLPPELHAAATAEMERVQKEAEQIAGEDTDDGVPVMRPVSLLGDSNDAGDTSSDALEGKSDERAASSAISSVDEENAASDDVNSPDDAPASPRMGLRLVTDED